MPIKLFGSLCQMLILKLAGIWDIAAIKVLYGVLLLAIISQVTSQQFVNIWKLQGGGHLMLPPPPPNRNRVKTTLIDAVSKFNGEFLTIYFIPSPPPTLHISSILQSHSTLNLKICALCWEREIFIVYTTAGISSLLFRDFRLNKFWDICWKDFQFL